MDIHISGNKVIQSLVIILSFNLSYIGLQFICMSILDSSKISFSNVDLFSAYVSLYFPIFHLLIKHFINQEVLDFLVLLLLSIVKSMNVKWGKTKWWKHVLSICWAFGSRGVWSNLGSIFLVLYDDRTKEIQTCITNQNPKLKKKMYVWKLEFNEMYRSIWEEMLPWYYWIFQMIMVCVSMCLGHSWFLSAMFFGLLYRSWTHLLIYHL